MPNYDGNAICERVIEKGLDYFYSAKDHWLLVYGDSQSIPKIMAFVYEVNDFNKASEEEKRNADMALQFAGQLRLPYIYVRFMNQSNTVRVWELSEQKWKTISYDELKDIFKKYGAVCPGQAKKPVNQYTSSRFQEWQKDNLGAITVSDFDMLKIKNNQIEEIIELKRSKIDIKSWKPFPQDFPNFALLINSIVNSGANIPFTLYYNEYADGKVGERIEDISQIKVFSFVIPDKMIDRNQVSYTERGTFPVDELL